MPDLYQALRNVLAASPASIESAAPATAAAVDRLLEASLLEPFAFARARERGDAGRLSDRRRSAWQLAHACALARFGAQQDALDVLREEALGVDAVIELLPATQMAFFIHAAGELRPLVAVDVHVPPEHLKAVHSAMRRRRFCPYDDQGGLITEGSPPSRESRLPRRWVTLERDGVLVRFHGASPGQELGPSLAYPGAARSPSTGLKLLSRSQLRAAIEDEILRRRFSGILPSILDLHALQASAAREREAPGPEPAGPSRVLGRLAGELFDPSSLAGDPLGEWTRTERRLLRLARLSAPAQTRQPRVAERIGEALADLLQPRAVLDAARAGR